MDDIKPPAMVVLDELELYSLRLLVEVYLDRCGKQMAQEIPFGFQALARAEYKLRQADKPGLK